MATPSKNSGTKNTGWIYKHYQNRQVRPIKLMPGGKIVARYQDNEFELVCDHLGQPIPYKLIP